MQILKQTLYLVKFSVICYYSSLEQYYKAVLVSFFYLSSPTKLVIKFMFKFSKKKMDSHIKNSVLPSRHFERRIQMHKI